MCPPSDSRSDGVGLILESGGFSIGRAIPSPRLAQPRSQPRQFAGSVFHLECTTSATKNVAQGEAVTPVNGRASVTLEPESATTFVSL